MFARQRTTWLLAIFVGAALLLSACERPLNRGDDESDTQEPLPTVVITQSETVTDEVQENPDESEERPEPEATSTEAAPEVEPTETAPAVDPTPTESTNAGDNAQADDSAADEETTGDEEGSPSETEEPTDSETESDTGDTEGSAQEEGEQTDTNLEPTLPVTHTVAAGENLYRISLLYGIPMAELAAYNNIINVDQISVGQVLLIPGGTESEINEPEPPEEQLEPEEPPVEDSGEGTLYTVQLGDTLGKIGLQFGVSWVEIAEANGIENPNEIYEGQVLKIPTSAPGPNPQFSHTVSPGETLNIISLHYGVSWSTIASANHLGSPYMIFPGQTLVIPGA